VTVKAGVGIEVPVGTEMDGMAVSLDGLHAVKNNTNNIRININLGRTNILRI
jgi:hypothetical protein